SAGAAPWCPTPWCPTSRCPTPWCPTAPVSSSYGGKLTGSGNRRTLAAGSDEPMGSALSAISAFQSVGSLLDADRSSLTGCDQQLLSGGLVARRRGKPHGRVHGPCFGTDVMNCRS